MKESIHLVVRSRLYALPSPIATRDAEGPHELGQRVSAKHNFTGLPGSVPLRSQSQAINRRGSWNRRVACDSPVAVMMSVYGPLTRLYWRRSPGLVRGNAAQRQQPRHEAKIGFRFAGRDKLVHLIEARV